MISTLLAVFVSFIALFRANSVDHFLLSKTSLFLTTITLYLFTLTHDLFGALTEVVLAPFIIFINWSAGLINLPSQADSLSLNIKKLFNRTKPKKKIGDETISSLIKGILITFPLVGLTLILLTVADPIFAKILKDVFSFKLPHIEEWLVKRIVFNLIFVISVLPLVFMKIKGRFFSPLQSPQYAKHTITISVAVFSLAVVLGGFLLVQYKYLFAQVSEIELHQFGVQTYSEYVKKGFWELTLVSAIVYLTVGVSMVIYRQKSSNRLRVLNTFLLFEVFLFIISIFRRLYLYQLAHGFTRVRVYGSLFLILVLALTAILILRHFVKKQVVDWYLWEIAAVLFFVFLGVGLNVDQLVANRLPPTVNSEIDYVYISRLSADAHEGWVKAYNHAKGEINELSQKPPGELNDDEIRRIVYAYYTLQNLKARHQELTYRYGKVKEIKVYTKGYEVPEPKTFKKLNFAEKFAYAEIKTEIPAEELIAVFEKADFLFRYLNVPVPGKIQWQKLDRSLHSPLL